MALLLASSCVSPLRALKGRIAYPLLRPGTNASFLRIDVELKFSDDILRFCEGLVPRLIRIPSSYDEGRFSIPSVIFKQIAPPRAPSSSGLDLL